MGWLEGRRKKWGDKVVDVAGNTDLVTSRINEVLANRQISGRGVGDQLNSAQGRYQVSGTPTPKDAFWSYTRVCVSRLS